MSEEERAMWAERIQARRETVDRLLKEKLQVTTLLTVVRMENGFICMMCGDSGFHLGSEQTMQLREIISGPPLEIEERAVKEKTKPKALGITTTRTVKSYYSLQERWQRIVDELDDEVCCIQTGVGEYPFHWTHPLDEETEQAFSKQDREYVLQKSGETIILAGDDPEEDVQSW